MADDPARAEKLAAARKRAAEKLKEKKAKEKKGKAVGAEAETEKQPDEEAPASPSAPAPAPAAAAAAAAAADTTEPAAVPAEETTTTESSGTTADASASAAALEARLKEVEGECTAAKSARDEAQLTADALEKKVESLETLHREDTAHISRLESDLADLRSRLEAAEAEALRLSKRDAQDSGGTDGEHLDELEDEERKKLEGRIRELEAENTDLRRGVWQQRRRDLQVGMEEAAAGGAGFDNVDLGATSPPGQRRQGGLGDLFASGLNALTGAGGHGHEHDDDAFLDDDEDFDEDAFRKAQEEAAKARIERIKEVKRGLKNWEGWRLDLVEGRSGGGEGIGEIFEI